MEDLTTKTQQELIEEVEALRKEVKVLNASVGSSVSIGEKLARVILDQMYQFVALLDIKGDILEVNKTALDGAGILLSDIAGKPFWQARWWEKSPHIQEQLQASVKQAATGEFVRYEVEIYGGDSGKELIWIDFSIIPVRDEAGKVIYLLPEGRNITEKKRAEAEIIRKNEELRVLYEKLKEFDELKTQFFANISHELRTPLALILGPIQEVIDSKALSQEERQSLQVVERNARILLKQVNDLLDVAKLEAGKMNIRFVESNLAYLVRIMASNFEALAKEKEISFKVDVPQYLTCEFDPEKIQRVILNLLSNAFKYTPTQGSISCSLEAKNGRAILKVADSGPGVKQESRQLIFERFRQLEGGSTRKFGGTGLGLAIVKDFLEMHNGTITVEDASQGGASFTVAIPLQAPKGVEVHKQTVLEAGFIEDLTLPVLDEIRLDKKTQAFISKDESYPLILVVEDNADLNRFITKTLSQLYRVASAMDGQEGLEKALRLNPDLILSDVMMPRMSGDQMVEELTKYPQMKQVPIVMLTAKADEGLRVKMLSGGVQDYLVKPFSAQEVKARVGNLIAMKQAKEILQQELDSKNADIAQLAKEAVRIKRELEQNYIQLQRVNNDLDHFVYTASHDLRSPIANLEGLLQMLSRKMEGNLHEQEKRMLSMMAESVGKLRRTIDDLSQVAKVQKEEVPQEPLLFMDLVKEVEMDLSQLIRESGAHIKVDLQAETIYYPRKHLRSILYNLLSNALKYRSAERTPVIEVCTQEEEKTISLSVKDNGLGLEEKQVNKLFGIFKRFHTHVEGSGVGLYIVKRMVENNGGTINVNTQLDKGSEFKICFQTEN